MLLMVLSRFKKLQAEAIFRLHLLRVVIEQVDINTEKRSGSVTHTMALLLLRGESAVFFLFCRTGEMF